MMKEKGFLEIVSKKDFLSLIRLLYSLCGFRFRFRFRRGLIR